MPLAPVAAINASSRPSASAVVASGTGTPSWRNDTALPRWASATNSKPSAGSNAALCGHSCRRPPPGAVNQAGTKPLVLGAAGAAPPGLSAAAATSAVLQAVGPAPTGRPAFTGSSGQAHQQHVQLLGGLPAKARAGKALQPAHHQ